MEEKEEVNLVPNKSKEDLKKVNERPNSYLDNSQSNALKDRNHEANEEDEEVSIIDKEDEVSKPVQKLRAPDMPTLSEDVPDEDNQRRHDGKTDSNSKYSRDEDTKTKPKESDVKRKEDTKTAQSEPMVDLTQGDDSTQESKQTVVDPHVDSTANCIKQHETRPQASNCQDIKQEKHEKKRNNEPDNQKRSGDSDTHKKHFDTDHQRRSYEDYQKRMADFDYQKKSYEDYQKRLADSDYQKRSYDEYKKRLSDIEPQKRSLDSDNLKKSYDFEYQKKCYESDYHRRYDHHIPMEVDNVKTVSIPRENSNSNKHSQKIDEREHKRSKSDKVYPNFETSPAPLTKIPDKSPPTVVVIDDSERNSNSEDKKIDVDNVSGNTTPRLDNSVEAQQPATPVNPGSVKQTPPQPEIPSMGVYTPDSTTNSVHSLHGYGQCDIDVSQLGLESPTSISSNDMPPSVGAPEPPRPPSSQAYTDCVQQNAIFHHHHVSSSPQHCPPSLPQYQTAPTKQTSSRSKSSQSVGQHHSRNRSTPPAPSPAIHRSTPPQQSTRHHQQSYPHHHAHTVVSQSNYSLVPQMQSGTYVGVPMTTVIQHRMTPGSQPSPNQRVGSSPSCSVPASTNFYIQNIQPPMHPHAHTTTPSPTTCAGMPQTTQSGTPSCSLAKLQQLTNGLDMIPPGHCANMTPPPPMNLTPPPSSHPAMTPPPSAHQMLQQPNLASYHAKFYPSNMTPTPSGRSSSRSASVQMPPTTSSRAGVTPNVTLNPNLMASYQFNGYRMPGQQSPATVTGYITNTGFINQGQIPVQMGVMNQYTQDPAAIQQNTMYTTYGYINSNLINGTLRR